MPVFDLTGLEGDDERDDAADDVTTPEDDDVTNVETLRQNVKSNVLEIWQL